MAAGVSLLRSVPVDFVISEDRSEFNVWLKLPLGSPLDQTRQAATAVEDEIWARAGGSRRFTTSAPASSSA